MRIQIIGAGVIGQATGKGFARLGHEVHFYDVLSGVVDGLRKDGYGADWQVGMGGVGLCFICVPEKLVEKVAESWSRPGRLLVVRSTVTPGTTRSLSLEYTAHFCSNPEFLREAVAEYEFLNPPGIIIGECCKEHGDLLEELYTPFRKPIYRTTPEVAELTKLAVNGYLACQISYWNQIKLLADKLGINSHEVGMLATFGDDRVSTYGARMHGKPYGGKCLPKDLKQLMDLCKEKEVNDILLYGIRTINDKYVDMWR